jgi:hypothetical protein
MQMKGVQWPWVSALYFLVCVGCMEAKKEPLQPQRVQPADSLTMAGWRIQNIVGNFFPLDTSVVLKENNYFFSETSNHDTSFVLILRREKGKVSGAYYEVLPGDDISMEPRMFSVHGFSFDQDTSIWNVVLHRSEDLIDAPYDNDTRCLHCPLFAVGYNHRSNISDPKSEAKFKQHAIFLKKLLIVPIRKIQAKE